MPVATQPSTRTPSGNDTSVSTPGEGWNWRSGSSAYSRTSIDAPRGARDIAA
ncbi:hypothetical protein D3C86_1201760 [compost metagenome]